MTTGAGCTTVVVVVPWVVNSEGPFCLYHSLLHVARLLTYNFHFQDVFVHIRLAGVTI